MVSASKGIVFDIDDTLYCRQVMLIHAAEIVLGVSIPTEELEKLTTVGSVIAYLKNNGVEE